MQEPARLYDLIDRRKELHPEHPVFKFKKNGEWKKQSKEVMTADKTVISRYQKVMDKYNAELDDTQNVKRFALVADIWSESTKFLIPIQ